MTHFPRHVCEAMKGAGAAVTCMPVRLDGAEWETAFFFHLAGPESKADRRVLSHSRAPLTVGIETDLIAHESAAVVVLRLEVFTLPDDPLAGEILLTPGGSTSHFESLQTLTRQSRLSWFFADADFRVLHSQQHALADAQRAGFDELLRDAVSHDALIRVTGRYDHQAALAAVVANYELRASVSSLPPPMAGRRGGGVAN